MIVFFVQLQFHLELKGFPTAIDVAHYDVSSFFMLFQRVLIWELAATATYTTRVTMWAVSQMLVQGNLGAKHSSAAAHTACKSLVAVLIVLRQ